MNGDQQAFTRALARHKDRIYGHCWAVLRNEDDAADATQEAFLRLWDRGGDLPEEAVRAWLLRVAHNLCLDQKRRQGAALRNFGVPDPDAVDRLADPGHAPGQPETDLLRGTLREEILEAMGTLTPETRSVMVMHYFQGLKVKEIAAVLDKNLNSVKVQIHRARKAMRLVLADRDIALQAVSGEGS